MYMKIIKHNLSLLLVITILFSMVVSATSVSAAEPTKLLELDMSGLEAVALKPSATSGEVTSGITKSGSLASSTTLSFSKRPDGENKITKMSFPNGNGGTTYYFFANSNSDPSYEYGTVDNLIEFVKNGNKFVYKTGDSLSSTTKDDNNKKVPYTFTVDSITTDKATLTFTVNN